ncbi:MAG TPA: helical backbone metal receptor [Gemmatimonadaceae bacterium]|nr:helical backbone metal receptor [Gemmatimonadaceae bacterium]
MYFPRRFVAYTLLLTFCACKDHARKASDAVVDDFGDVVHTDHAPTRIVSLNPSTTEILFALGAADRLVGRSNYDWWPDSAKLIPALGDGIRPNVEAVLAAHPDLVLLYASLDNRAAASRLRSAGVNTLSLKIDHIADFARGVRLLGTVIGDTVRARIVVDSVQRTLASVRAATQGLTAPKVFWHIWDAPIMTIGGGSFMNELVDIAGARNVYADIKSPSAEISLEDISRRDPDFILAGPVGKRQIESDPRWLIVRAARDHKILVVDTTLVARPAVRLGEAAVSLARLLHPGVLR